MSMTWYNEPFATFFAFAFFPGSIDRCRIFTLAIWALKMNLSSKLSGLQFTLTAVPTSGQALDKTVQFIPNQEDYQRRYTNIPKNQWSKKWPYQSDYSSKKRFEKVPFRLENPIASLREFYDRSGDVKIDEQTTDNVE